MTVTSQLLTEFSVMIVNTIKKYNKYIIETIVVIFIFLSSQKSAHTFLFVGK